MSAYRVEHSTYGDDAETWFLRRGLLEVAQIRRVGNGFAFYAPDVAAIIPDYAAGVRLLRQLEVVVQARGDLAAAIEALKQLWEVMPEPPTLRDELLAAAAAQGWPYVEVRLSGSYRRSFGGSEADWRRDVHRGKETGLRAALRALGETEARDG